MIGLVVSNLLYLGVAVVVAVLGALVVVVRQRKPKSVEANVASFNKGLRALAPDDEAERPAAKPSWGGAHKPVLVPPSDPPSSSAPDEESASDPDASSSHDPAASDASGAGTESATVDLTAPTAPDAPVEGADHDPEGSEPLTSEEAGTG